MKVTVCKTCRVCGSTELSLLIDYGTMPLAGSFLEPGDNGSNIAFPLRLARCSQCTLMQVLDTVPPEIIFTKYSYASSTTRTLVTHFSNMAMELARIADGELIVEFGCNDGVLLRPLISSGAKAIGVDPSDVALKASQGQGWPLINDFFLEEVANRIRHQHGPAFIVTGNNVFAHTNDIHAIMWAVTSLLADDGLFIFEVHYQGDLLELVQFDTVYHEHISYYSLTSLSQLMSRHGLRIVDVNRIPIHAGSIRVTASRTTSELRTSPLVYQMLESEKGWNIELFVRRVRTRRLSLIKLVKDLNDAGRNVVAYGAAGRSTIMLNFCSLDRELVKYVVDMSPLRHGKLVPGVLTPIVPPEVFNDDLPDYAIMTAWNYEDEIVAKEQSYLEAGGRFIVPLPQLRVAGAV